MDIGIEVKLSNEIKKKILNGKTYLTEQQILKLIEEYCRE